MVSDGPKPVRQILSPLRIPVSPPQPITTDVMGRTAARFGLGYSQAEAIRPTAAEMGMGPAGDIRARAEHQKAWAEGEIRRAQQTSAKPRRWVVEMPATEQANAFLLKVREEGIVGGVAIEEVKPITRDQMKSAVANSYLRAGDVGLLMQALRNLGIEAEE